MKENVTLGHEKKKLSEQILAFDMELKSSNALVDRLYKDIDKYQTKQKDYETVIRKCKNAAEVYKKKMDGLRSQLEGAKSMVPIGRYQKAVGSVKSLTRSLQVKENEINRLTQRIHQLEAIVTESDGSSNMEKSTSKSLSSTCETDNINDGPKDSSPSSVVSRHETIRALGGRAAMRERMVKARRSQTNGKGSVNNRAALKPLHENIASTSNTSASSYISTHGKENY